MSLKKELVVKSNRLVEASYRLTEIEMQIVLYSICRSREDGVGLSPKDPLTIRADDFVARFGTNTNKVYGQLKNAMDTLYKRTLIIRDEDPKTGKPRVVETRWISDKAYIDGAGQIQITFAHKVIPFISQLEGDFTPYLLKQIGRMTSVYAVRLYELLLQYLKFGKREISIVWLKDALQITGYDALKDLKRRVIDVAVDQINKYSDINVSYTNIKTGRAITGFMFTIKRASTETAAAPVTENNIDNKTLLAFVPEAHRAKKSVIAAIASAEKKQGFDYVKRNILYSNTHAAKSYAGFLNSALKQDWGHDWELEQQQAMDEKKTANAVKNLNNMEADVLLRVLVGHCMLLSI